MANTYYYKVAGSETSVFKEVEVYEQNKDKGFSFLYSTRVDTRSLKGFEYAAHKLISENEGYRIKDWRITNKKVKVIRLP